MASLDTRRPAAMEQLAVLGQQVGIETLPIVAGQSAVQIARRALDAARLGGFDVVMLDTAGRVTVDEALMAEVAEVKAATSPHEVLLVADALTGQDAVNTARAFDSRLGVTGIVLTRMDGDARGGAALSMRAVTGKPIKLIGTGEKVDALEEFHPQRVASRILGMGDIVSLVERAAETIDQEKALRAVEKMRKGKFDLDDLRDQLAQMEKIGGVGGMLGMLPGIAKMKSQLAGANLDDKVIKRQRAIIDSMTPQERRSPDILKASRKKRIAAGAGAKVEEVNKLLKMHRQMADMMKMMGGGKGRGLGQAPRQHVRAGGRGSGRDAAADARATRSLAEADGRRRGAAGLVRRLAADAARPCRQGIRPAGPSWSRRRQAAGPRRRFPVRRQEEVTHHSRLVGSGGPDRVPDLGRASDDRDGPARMTFKQQRD